MIMETRYQRHIQLNEVGTEGQLKIKKANVYIVICVISILKKI